jgi:outer membrane protein insertion porin family
MVVIALSVAVILSPGTAQAQSFRFSNFIVEGNQRVDASTVLSYAQIAPGEAVSSAELNEAFQSIMASGLFERAELVPQGNTLRIVVQEWPTINQIAIEGNRRLDDDDLLPLIRSTPRRVYSPTVAEQDAATLVEALEQRGLLAATVEPRIIRRSDNRVDLVFEVTEGRTVENQRISFVGNRAFTDRRLRRVLETKQAGLLRAFFRSDTLITDRLEFDQQVLRDFYLSRGYVDFEILDVSAELSRERNATFITFQVREGQQFRFGEMTASTDLPNVDPDEFLRAARLRSGVVYSPVLIDRAIVRMEGLANQKSLDFIRIEPRVTRNERALTLDIEFVITRGPRIFVERIDIEGNATTLDRVIRRQFRIAEGDPFNPREIRNSAARIESLNFFSSVDVTPREGSGPDQVIVDVDVEERPTGSLGLGASYSSDGGVGLLFSFEETNFLGRGQALNFEYNSSKETTTGQFSFTEPALLGRNLALTYSLFVQQSDNNNADFDTSSFGTSLALRFPVGEFSSLQVRYGFSYDEVLNIATTASPIIQREAGERTRSSIDYSYRYDTRTRGLDPSAGVLLTFAQQFAGLGGDVEYLRTVATATAQKRLRNEDYTLRAVVEAGNVSSFGGYSTKVGDRFFLSSNQLRGFDFRGVGPRDTNAPGNTPLGGNNYAAARFEFGFPIGFVEDLGVSGGLFFDMGSVWGLEDVVGQGGAIVDDGFNLRSAVGLSLFWETPFGPLTFNFSEPIQKEDYDKTRSFDLSLTARF